MPWTTLKNGRPEHEGDEGGHGGPGGGDRPRRPPEQRAGQEGEGGEERHRVAGPGHEEGAPVAVARLAQRHPAAVAEHGDARAPARTAHRRRRRDRPRGRRCRRRRSSHRSARRTARSRRRARRSRAAPSRRSAPSARPPMRNVRLAAPSSRPALPFATPLGRVAELADALASGASVRKDVGVQVPPRPPLDGQTPSNSYARLAGHDAGGVENGGHAGFSLLTHRFATSLTPAALRPRRGCGPSADPRPPGRLRSPPRPSRPRAPATPSRATCSASATEAALVLHAGERRRRSSGSSTAPGGPHPCRCGCETAEPSRHRRQPRRRGGRSSLLPRSSTPPLGVDCSPTRRLAEPSSSHQ